MTDKMDKMGKGTLQTQSGKMAKEKVRGEPESFSALGIGSSIMYLYIRD